MRRFVGTAPGIFGLVSSHLGAFGFQIDGFRPDSQTISGLFRPAEQLSLRTPALFWRTPSPQGSRLWRCNEALQDTIGKMENIKFVKQLCPEGAWGPELRNTSEKNVWGLRPHTFFTLSLRNLGPRTPSRHNVCAILIFCVSRIVPGDAQLQPLGMAASPGQMWVLFSGGRA